MARTLRRLTPLLGALPLALLWALPLALALAMLAPAAGDQGAWQAAFAHPQLKPALMLSLLTGAAATLSALLLVLVIIAGLGRRLGTWLQHIAAAGLALPHLAFAIGFGVLITPSGVIARLLLGGDVPPQWVTVQDPWGLSLAAALALKEVPFLLTAALSALARGDAAARISAECRAAASMGHGAGSAFLRIVLPQLFSALRWPLVIVFVYGATVVDMALVLGPTQPPTLAVVIWHALNDVEPAVNAMGLAATLILTLGVAGVIALAALALAIARPSMRRFLSAGPSRLASPQRMAVFILAAMLTTFVAALLVLALLSAAPRWPYPALLPPSADLGAWATVAESPAPLWLSLLLSLAVSATSVALALLWFEMQGAARDRWVIGLSLLSLALPQLAVAGGQYRLFLGLGLTGDLGGLFLAHLTPTLAYVLIVLQGPYRAFDERYVQAARALSASRLRTFLRVKLPLLKAPVLTAGAVGFAVSIAQFVPAQLIAAGRFSTLPMEAVTLSSGGNRPLTAAFALLLALPPLLCFLLAARLGRPRWG